MATLTHVQSGRLYSWWWDSHISPKNSKWLQENLSDMDIKVKAMIKLIEEDADSFARRAEMYYKKRPELMKLVEEFYRAYRALAERYDHATGALRQAQRTITEAFPNQIPFLLPDESPLGSSNFEMEPPGPPRFKEGLQESDSEEKGGSDYQIICLQEEISRLLNDNQNLMDQALLESVRGDRAEAEVQSLKDTISKLVSEKEAALFQYQTSLDKISNLETEFSCMYKELKKHNDDMLVGLQEQICQLKEENGTLNEQNLSSGLSIKNLQGEVGLHEEEKQILHQKLSSLEENKIDLEDKHNGLTKQIEAVNSSVESLQALAKELKDENIELKELCKKHEVEKGLQLQHMDKISEKNAILENSLSERNNELELLREKIRALQELCESLHDKIYGHITEKAVLVSQIEVITQNTEKLSDKNIFLDKSLCEVNAELEGLRQTLKGLEDSFQLLLEQKNNLLGEKNALVNQVESVSQSLEIMEKTFAELEDKHLNLEKENRSTLLQVSELQNLLKSEGKEHETLIRSSNNKLLALEKQIHILQEEGRLREEELIAEQYKAMNAHMENFIYQRCISDMKEKNLVFSTEWQKILEKSRCADELISKLEQEHLLLKEKGTILSKQNEKLREGLHQILETLTFGKNTGSSDGNKDESLLRLILCEIRAILNNIAETQDEKQNLLLEKSIIITVLKHFGLEMADLKLEKGFLEQESKVIVEELVVVQTKRNELQGINEQLKLELHSKNQNEELLKSETEIICQKLSDVREAYRILLEEHNSSSKKLYNMEVNKYALEKENTDILAKAMTLEHLYLIFKSYNAERVSDLKSLAGYLHSLHEVQNVLDRFIQMNNKLGALEIEIMNLKDPIINLDDDIEKASNQAKMNNELSVNKELVFSQADQMSQLLEARNTELHKEINDLKSREELLIFELKKGANELQKSELEFATILHDIQKAIVQATIFEEKVLELLTVSKSVESGSLAQRELLKDEIASRNSRLDELKNRLSDIGAGNSRLKAKLDVYLPLILSLWKSIASLEKDTLSLAKHHTSMNQEDQIGYNYYETSEDCNATGLSGVLLLQKLHAKVEALRKVVADMGNLLEKERFVSNANLEATKKESVALDSEGRLVQQKLDSDHELQEDNVGSSKLNNNQITKDIPLDIVRTTPDRNDVSSPDAANDAKILELWEITEGHDSEHHNARATEAEKSNRATSKIVVEKELSINKLEASDKVKEPNQEWNKRILVTLASDAERLSLLQMSIGELKRKIELSGMPPSYEFEAIKEQTKEAEAAISDSVNVNNKLRKKAEIFSASTESLAGEFNEKGMGNTRRTQISERTRRESENIGMLEFELQKIEYVLLKLEEEHKYNRERTSGKRWRVSLRDYLYGKRDGRRKGKAYFCVCLKPSSMFDCISCAK